MAVYLLTFNKVKMTSNEPKFCRYEDNYQENINVKISGGGFQRSNFKPYASQIGVGNKKNKSFFFLFSL